MIGDIRFPFGFLAEMFQPRLRVSQPRAPMPPPHARISQSRAPMPPLHARVYPPRAPVPPPRARVSQPRVQLPPSHARGYPPPLSYLARIRECLTHSRTHHTHSRHRLALRHANLEVSPAFLVADCKRASSPCARHIRTRRVPADMTGPSLIHVGERPPRTNDPTTWRRTHDS